MGQEPATTVKQIRISTYYPNTYTKVLKFGKKNMNIGNYMNVHH